MADSTRIQQLKALQSSLPVANQKVAQGLQSAQDINLKQSIKAATPGAGPGAAQALGAAQTAAKGQPLIQAAQQTAKQTGQVAQMGLAETGLQAQQELGAAQRNVSGKQREYSDRLSKLGNELKDKLVDENLEIRKDARGQALLNDRQLADYALATATSQEQLKSYAQAMEQASSREMQMLEQAYNLITTQLSQMAAKGELQMNQEQTMRLAQQKQALEQEIARKQRKAANKAGIITAAFTIGGAVAGTMIPIPGVGTTMGAAGGAMVGQGVGQVVAGSNS
jgi:hypothetical protein